jgi:acetolactate synthase-1/2/3 large subunit
MEGTSRAKTATKVAVITRPQQTGARLVVRALEAQGVSHVFGIPGAKIDAVFNELVDSKIKTVVCRHEQNAAFIAGGIGRMTGKAGVAIATSGPGISNLVTGLATANSEGDPVVAFGGAVAAAEALKQIHQTMDAVSILKPVTKFSATVGASDQIGEVVVNAFRTAESGRPGASYVNLPKDVMTAACTREPLPAPAFSGPGPADRAAIKEAARLINAARIRSYSWAFWRASRSMRRRYRPSSAKAISRWSARSRPRAPLAPCCLTTSAGASVNSPTNQPIGCSIAPIS